jgi:hypothetical protein
VADAVTGDWAVLVMVGRVLVTVTVLLPLTALLVAVTVPLAVVVGAVNRPLALTVPPVTVVVQVNVGCAVKALPNWSLPVAVNCCVPAAFRLADVGLRVIVVSVWFTVTVTELVAVREPGSVIVTWNV